MSGGRKWALPCRDLEMPGRLLLIWLAACLLCSCATGRLQKVPASVPPVTSAEFAAEMARITGEAWTLGNDVRTLPNGGYFIPAMLRAIREARQTINWENFVCVDSQPVADFSQAFIAKAREGVKVQVLLDHYGCNTYGMHHVKAMREAGVKVHFYSPWKLHNPFRYNHRTHRRILVVDGQIGFVGGAGLAYAWDGHAEDSLRWRDTMYEAHGPVVRQLQQAFQENWREVTRVTFAGPEYFPEIPAAGALTAQSVLGSPGKKPDTIGSSFLLALRAARQSIRISHAYFIPNKPIEKTLFEARRRGVKVEILIPGKHTDMPICLSVTQPLLRRLMAAGVDVYEFEPCMMHGKLVVIDDHLSIIGSGNLDQRSFFINDENNLLVSSAIFAREQIRMNERDKARSRRLNPADLQLPLFRRVQGFLGRCVQHQL